MGLLLLAACSPGEPKAQPQGATVPTAAPTTTTTNPYAVPPVIDAAYVNRVLAGLDAVFGDAFRLMVSTRTVSTESLDRLKAVYGDGDLLNLQLKVVQDNLLFDRAKIPANPGDKRTWIDTLISASATCIFASVDRDYSAVTGVASPFRREWIALRPLATASDPNRYNSTGWAYTYEGFDPNRQPPATSPCATAS